MTRSSITSLQNPLVKDVQRLLEKSRERKKKGLFVVEGIREVSLALSKGYKPETLLICQEIYRPDEVYPIELSPVNREKTIHISPGIYNKLAYRNNAEGILMVSGIRDHSLENLSPGKNPLILILEKVEKPGNLGAILRTCDAAGVDAVIICDPLTDLYNPNIIRSSLGCVFTQNIASSTIEDILPWLAKNSIKTFAADPYGDLNYDQQDYTGPTALVFGSESMGLSKKISEVIDHKISIQMSGMIDSLNVSVSAAIIIFEAKRQRKTTNT